MPHNTQNSPPLHPQPPSRLRKSLAARKAHMEWARRQWARRRRPARRRGVILLVTLVLLTLFTMMLITFVVATVTNRQSVTPTSRVEQSGDSPESILHDAFLQVVRGPRNPNSPLVAHSLLEDKLGSDSMVLNIPTALPNFVWVTSGGGAVTTPIVQIAWTTGGSNPYPRANQLPPPPGHYAGREIMLLNGPGVGTMAQVIGSDYDASSGLYSMTIYGFTQTEFSTLSIARFLVNGKPFSGTGFGFKPLSFDPTAPNATSGANPTYTRLLDAYWLADDGAGWQMPLLQALAPNHRQGVFAGMIDPYDPYGGNYSQYPDPAGPGGANEDYDAADFQNPHLSMATWNGGSMQTILPSFHRPDLIQYWNARVMAVPASPSNITRQLLPPINSTNTPTPDPTSLRILRKIVMRPLPYDHLNFTGSNPAMQISNAHVGLIQGPWDVDNDNDGDMDSVWLDIGLPVQTAPDGRRYKPLVAFLIRDLDGRLNLNAHSSWRHAPSSNPNISRFLPVQAPFALAPGVSTQPGPYRLRVGQGYGPAEISLSPLFAPYPLAPAAEAALTPPYSVTYPVNANGLSEMGTLLGGDPTINVNGRYGEVQLTGNVKLGGGSPYPGISFLEEPFSWIQRSQFPQFKSINPQQIPYCYLPLRASNPILPANTFTIDNSQISAPLADGSQIWIRASGYGSSFDLDGDGMLALGLRGEPLYIDFTYLATGGGEAAGWGEPNDTFDNQYEVDLSLVGRNGSYTANTWSTLPSFTPNLLTAPYTAQTDATFSAAELERVLRSHDADAMTLPDRLPRLAPNTFTNPGPGQIPLSRMRQVVTTEQYDMSQASMAYASHDMVSLTYPTTKAVNAAAIPPVGDATIASLLRARLLSDNAGNTAYTMVTPATNNTIKMLLPAEILMGQKFDINRLLGNGRDDNLNGAVDEPGEVERAWAELYGAPVQLDLNNDGLLDGTATGAPYPAGATFTDVNSDGMFDARDIPPIVDLNSNGVLDHDTNGVYNTGEVPGMMPRQQLARQLYILMMLLKDPAFRISTIDVDGNNAIGNAQIPGAPAGFAGVASDADTACYIAQLAINMVDFRDRDAIMTSFEYDVFPFRDDDGNTNNGTWDVDGFVAGFASDGTTRISPDDAPAPYRGLVWGCERPELLITESIATHDRRSRDTNLDTNSKVVDRSATPKDSNFDQVRRPLGTIAVELMNPNPPMTIGNKFQGEAPNELYALMPTTDAAGNARFGVNLSKVTTADANGNTSPVWRLATLRTDAPTITPRAVTVPTNSIDRIVYFVNLSTNVVNLWEKAPNRVRVFSAQPGGFVAPGTYALVAPAAANTYGANAGLVMYTPLGMRDTTQDATTPPYLNTPSAAAPGLIVDKYPRLLVLSNSVNPTYIGVCDYQYNPLTPNIKPTVGVWVGPTYTNGAAVLPDVNTATKSLRFSLTEPDMGYPLVTAATTTTKLLNPPGPATDLYRYNENGYYDASVKYPDTPYDENPNTFNVPANPNKLYDQKRQTLITATAPYGTVLGVTNIVLQRLANPLTRWDPIDNPYITVDQMPLDLTVYNSEMQTSAKPTAGNEEFQNIDATTASTWKFDTRRRSWAASPSPGTNFNNIWYQGSMPPGQPGITTPAPVALSSTSWADMLVGGASFMPRSTLGFLNNEYGYQAGQYGMTGLNRWTVSVGAGATYPPPVTINGQSTLANGGAEYYGDPAIPFPWLNWNNRPYVSGKELLLVPSGSPGSLLREMTLTQNGTGTLTSAGAYEPTGPNPVTGLPQTEFGHLANPFSSPALAQNGSTSPTTGFPLVAANASANLYRLLDLVHVPSRYTGTQDWIPPGFVGPNPSVPHYLHPPFNQIPRNRDPGKININTIFDPVIWQGLLDERLAGEQIPAWLNMYQSVWAARQGSGTTNGGSSIFGGTTTAFASRGPLLNSALAGNMPTIFAKPFRAASGNSLVPLAQMRLGHAGTDTNEREISSTLLRPDPTVRTFPMLEAPGAPPPVSGFFKEYVNPPIANPQNNPYFAYEEIRRIDNLVTTRSNVYAVWLTMGYFEVTPATNTADPDYAAKYPDGWMLGQEIGSDTGDIQRHRSFYIYDRSIPVGFERGENHNVDRGILVQRYIE